MKSAYWVSLGSEYQIKLTISSNFDQVFPKKCIFGQNIEKLSSTIEFCISELVFKPNFSLKWQFWIFGRNFPNKGISGPKEKKHTALLDSIYSSYSRYQISDKADNIDFLYQVCLKGLFSVCSKSIALLCVSMIFPYYIKCFCSLAQRYNGDSMSLLFLVAGTKTTWMKRKNVGKI